MEFERSEDGKALLVRLSGELFSNNTPELEARLREELGGITDLTFDLDGLQYVSSAGLRIFLSMQKRMKTQGSMVIRNVDEEIMEIFTVTGFSKLLNIQ